MNKKFTERSEKMRTFDKSTKLDNVLYDVRGPVVDEAARMEEDGIIDKRFWNKLAGLYEIHIGISR